METTFLKRKSNKSASFWTCREKTCVRVSVLTFVFEFVKENVVYYNWYFNINFYTNCYSLTLCFFSYFVDYSEFGGKIFALKPVVKVLPKLFDHSDKNVREEVNKYLSYSGIKNYDRIKLFHNIFMNFRPIVSSK